MMSTGDYSDERSIHNILYEMDKIGSICEIGEKKSAGAWWAG